jgi:metal-sulfur cluster biosynthetic enzyme
MPRDDAPVTEAPGLPGTQITEADIYTAIADVLDPELDEPLVSLGFIDRVQVEGPHVCIAMKLPTFWCAPNFAYLMASDLRARVLSLPGVRAARVELLDHSAEEEINRGVNLGQSFAQAFAGEVDGDEDLEELRRIFLRKGFLMRQDTLVRQLLKADLDEATILNLCVSDLAIDEQTDLASVTTPRGLVQLTRAGRNAGKYLQKGRSIGLFSSADAPLIVEEQGHAISPGSLKEFLRRSRSVRLNIMFNTSMCKGLFRTRYENAGASEAYPEGEMI